MLRQCRKCEQLKELEEFISSPGCAEGKGYTCKDCDRAYRRRYSKQAEAFKRAQEKYRQTDKRKAVLDRYKERRIEMANESTVLRKTCKKCGLEKLIIDFSVNKGRTKDGYMDVCRECRSETRRTPEEQRKARETRRKYDATPAGKAYRIRYLQKHPEKATARAVINFMVKLGMIPRVSTLKCDECGQPAKEYAHQTGYDTVEQWLDVKPMCIQCHRKIDSLADSGWV